MTPDDGRGGRVARDVLGEVAFTSGVVALVFVFVPIVGDFVAVPASLLAVTLGFVGVIREDRGLGLTSGRALTGGLLGVVAAFISFATYAAMGTFG